MEWLWMLLCLTGLFLIMGNDLVNPSVSLFTMSHVKIWLGTAWLGLFLVPAFMSLGDGGFFVGFLMYILVVPLSVFAITFIKLIRKTADSDDQHHRLRHRGLRDPEARITLKEGQAMPKSQFVGVDGCPSGWVSVGFGSSENHYELEDFSTFRDLLNHYKSAMLILVDIPIGLPDYREERCCDKQARKLLNQNGFGRGPAVFRTPVRAAVEYFGGNPYYGDVLGAVMRDLNEAVKAKCHKDVRPDIMQDVQREITKQIRHAITKGIQRAITGKSLSAQTLGIIPKIAEVDALLPDPRVREVHPEICFYGLNKGKPMQHSKHKEEGIRERLDVLGCVEQNTGNIFNEACKKFPGRSIKKDDIIDALAAAVTAKNGWPKEFKTLPENPKSDSEKLPMEMVYWQP